MADRTAGVRALVQRVSRARVTAGIADGAPEITGEIGPGILALVGVTHSDGAEQARKLAGKIWSSTTVPSPSL